MDTAQLNVEPLAAWQVGAMGIHGDPMAIGIVAHNLTVARDLDQIKLDLDGETCFGFVGWIRLTLPQLLAVARTGQSLFEPQDDTPHAPVLFLVEQLCTRPRQMHDRMRWLGTQPGVEVLAGWRGGRLRVHRVRAHRPPAHGGN